MQKKYADFKLGVPDYVTVETEEERLVCQGGQTTVAARCNYCGISGRR